jgi:hypothetical protein
VQLCEKRIQLLEELKMAVRSGRDLSIPDSHLRALHDRMPLLSDVSIDQDRGPHSNADDFLVSKAIIPQEEPVSFIKILPLRGPQTQGAGNTAQIAMPSALLVAVRSDGGVRLFSPSGEMYLSFSAGHENPVTRIAVSPSHDEYFLATADTGGIMRIHKVNVRQRWLSKEQKEHRRKSFDEKFSQYLGSQVNVTAQFTKTIKLAKMRRVTDDTLPEVTALTVASYQGTKYFVLGDEDGKVNVFTRNGTFAAQLNATSIAGERVDSLYSHLSTLVYRTGSRWGFINLDTMVVQPMHCPKFVGEVTAVIVDSQHSAKVLVADQDGTVWVFNMKEKRICKVEHRFPRGSTSAPLELASVRGYALVLEQATIGREGASLMALNMSHVGARRESLPDASGLPSGSVVWRKNRAAVKDWAVHKRFQQGDLIAFLSEDGYEIEVMELLMQIYQAGGSFDSFGDYQGVIVAVGILLVIGFQWARSKGIFGTDENELEKLAKAAQGTKKKKKKPRRDNAFDGF